MKVAPWLCLLSGLSAFAQTAPPPKPAATSSGTCSVANTGNITTLHIDCGISKDKGQEMVEILNKILKDHLDFAAVMAKLDEILKSVNPNRRTRVYFCTGQWQEQGPTDEPGVFALISGDDHEFIAFQKMVNLNNSHKYPELLASCLAQIQSTPEWLTPRLFCALAYLASHEPDKAREMLKEFEAREGPPYNAEECVGTKKFLHSKLDNPSTRF